MPTGPCYDVTVVIEKCSKLPVMDWHTFKADPYIVCKFVLPSGHSMAYRWAQAWSWSCELQRSMRQNVHRPYLLQSAGRDCGSAHSNWVSNLV